MARASTEQLNEFANALSVAIVASGLKRQEIARRLGVTTQAVDNYAGGAREPDVRTVAALERILGVPGELLPLLGYDIPLDGAERPVRLSASGGSLDELREKDPEYYRQLVELARLHLERRTR